MHMNVEWSTMLSYSDMLRCLCSIHKEWGVCIIMRRIIENSNGQTIKEPKLFFKWWIILYDLLWR